MNRMSEIAQMLGVELGEEFKIKGDDYSHFDKYRLTEERLEFFANGNWHDVSSTLAYLLNGQAKVVKIPKSLLTTKEREYLTAVIKPFREDFNYLLKYQEGEYEYLVIYLNGDFISLPDFKKDSMYKGLGVNKRYTLKELSL